MRGISLCGINRSTNLGLSMNDIRRTKGFSECRGGLLGIAAPTLPAANLGMPASLRGDVAWEGGNELERSAQLLAGLSHDLLTPIARMKLRAETISAHMVRQKLFNDLDEIEGMIRDVLEYTGSARHSDECGARLEIASFLKGLAGDYQDMGKEVVAVRPYAGVILSRPRTLRRLLTNLVDNALKFAGAAEIVTEIGANASLTVSVLDRGPGIPDEQLADVMKPFFRIRRDKIPAQGLGLGLAIANNLAYTLSGSLALRNREGGGLSAELRLPVSRSS